MQASRRSFLTQLRRSTEAVKRPASIAYAARARVTTIRTTEEDIIVHAQTIHSDDTKIDTVSVNETHFHLNQRRSISSSKDGP